MLKKRVFHKLYKLYKGLILVVRNAPQTKLTQYKSLFPLRNAPRHVAYANCTDLSEFAVTLPLRRIYVLIAQ